MALKIKIAKSEPFRFMEINNKIRLEITEDRLNSFAADFLASNRETVRNFTSLSQSVEGQEGRYIGYVIAEGNGRLNRESCLLQGCDGISSRSNIKLDFSLMEKEQPISVFPGQIVVVDGYVSGEGLCKRLVCRKIVDDFHKGPKSTDLKGIAPFDLIVASGPFITDGSTGYPKSALSSLAKVIRKERPKAVVLFGPFLPEDSAIIKKTDLRRNFSEIVFDFLDLFSKDLKEHCEESLEFVVLVVPSPKDINSFPILPQQPFDFKDKKLPQQIRLLSNPIQVELNNCSIALNCTDFVFDCLCTDLKIGKNVDSRWKELSKHFLKQNSFYPLHPPKDIGLNYNSFSQLSLDSPQIMVWTSPSTRISNKIAGQFNLPDCVAVYPGHISGGNGVYAKIFVRPGNAETIYDAVRTEIKRL